MKFGGTSRYLVGGIGRSLWEIAKNVCVSKARMARTRGSVIDYKNLSTMDTSVSPPFDVSNQL